MIIENQKNQSRYHLILIIPNLLNIIKTKDFYIDFAILIFLLVLFNKISSPKIYPEFKIDTVLILFKL